MVRGYCILFPVPGCHFPRHTHLAGRFEPDIVGSDCDLSKEKSRSRIRNGRSRSKREEGPYLVPGERIHD